MTAGALAQAMLVVAAAAAGGAPTIVTTNSGALAAGASPTVNLPASLVSGNRLEVLVEVAGNETIATPVGWTLVNSARVQNGTAGSDRALYVFEKTSDGLEGGTLVLVATGTTGGGGYQCYQINGAGSATLYASATGSAVAPDPPNNNPGSSAATLWIAGAAKRESATASGAPSGYANLLTGRTGSVSGMSADKTSTASSEDPGTFAGFSVSDNYVAVTLGFRA